MAVRAARAPAAGGRRGHRASARAAPAARRGRGVSRGGGVLGGRTFKSLREHRNYRIYFFGQLVSFSGSWMQDAALPWLVYELTHSATAVGLTILFRLGPSTILSLFIGDLADRFDNRRFLMATQAAQAIPALVTA